MRLFTLLIPYILKREVLTEKAHNVTTAAMYEHKKPISLSEKATRYLAYITYFIVSVSFSYLFLMYCNLQTNFLKWLPEERGTLLWLTPLIVFLISFYCSRHGDPDLENVLKIKYFSYNWYVKLCSIFVIYFALLFFVIAIISFCKMTLDFSQIIPDEQRYRALSIILLSCAAALVCGLSHNNVIKLFKIKE